MDTINSLISRWLSLALSDTFFRRPVYNFGLLKNNLAIFVTFFIDNFFICCWDKLQVNQC